MNRESLFATIVEAQPAEGDVVYVARRGEEYEFQLTPPGVPLDVIGEGGFPDAWVYWTGEWPGDDEARQRATFDDLLEEMETMTGSGPERCRWSLDDPWPRSH